MTSSDQSLADRAKEDKFFRLDAYELEVLLQMQAKKLLQHRDITVLLAFISLTDWRNGRCRTNCAFIGRLINKSKPLVSASVKRLKQYQLLVYCVNERNSGDAYYLLNPSLVICGSGRQRGFLIKQFNKAIENNIGYLEDEQAIHADQAIHD